MRNPLLLALLLPASALAVPTTALHQGRLFDGSGAPLTGDHDLGFALYDDATAGTELWSEDLVDVPFDAGFFTVTLGQISPLDAGVVSGDAVWLGVSVDGGAELQDRMQLASVPFALRAAEATLAQTAVNVDGGVVDASEIRVAGTTIIDSAGTILVEPAPHTHDHVTGTVQLGGNTAPCDSSTKGSLRYTGQLELCDGVSWSGVTVAPTLVEASTLLDERLGFGRGATGGLGGDLYIVHSTADDGAPGTLRHALQTATGPRWIVFDRDVFPVDAMTTIEVGERLDVPDAITIDGRGSQVRLQKTHLYSDAVWTDISGTQQCDLIADPQGPTGSILDLQAAHDVIITHVEFAQQYVGTPPTGPLDKQCFGDQIQVFTTANDKSASPVRWWDDIWLHQNNFENCGDECIAVVGGDQGALRGSITISYNRFSNTNKGMIVGGSSEPDFSIEASVLGNHFSAVTQRSPRIQDGLVMVVNNAVDDWFNHGTAIFDESRVTIEHNVYRAGSTDARPWHIYAGGTNQVRSNLNHYPGVSSPPADTGPWPNGCATSYYDCTDFEPAGPLLRYGEAPWTASTAFDDIVAKAGWRAAPNDVRD